MNQKLKNYSNEFIPDLQLEDFDHKLLAHYGREIMLANHIHDRGALVQVALKWGLTEQTAVAVDEWMGSSPIYNARNRHLLKMNGSDVGTILKGFQHDIGAPHNFLHFHFELESSERGFFWLTHCGAYNHIRQMTNADPVMETQICHHMEDPTFDATVMAVNSHARCKPIFRPPHNEVPAQGPCRWAVVIEEDIGLAEANPITDIVRKSLAAEFDFAPIKADSEGMSDYSGDFKRDFTLSDLGHHTLARQCKEYALDVHLLNRACYTSIAERWGEEVLVELAIEQWRAMAPLVAHRLKKVFSMRGDDMTNILKIIQLNPFLPKEYLEMGLELTDETQGIIYLKDCAALREPSARGIISLLTHHPETPGFEAMAQAVNPQAKIETIDPGECSVANAKIAWRISIDPKISPASTSGIADLVKGTDLWDFDNSEHIFSY
jgi:hypothetical protein